MLIKSFTTLSFLFLIGYHCSYAQMERKRVQVNGPVEETFWSQSIVGMGTVETMPANNLNVTIMHAFGLATNRPVQNFFGLDNPPNVRLGMDYGITDNWTLGIGRTTFQKVIDLRSKLALMRQTTSGSDPISLTLKGDIALVTQEDGLPISDDMSYLLAPIVGSKFNDHLSLQAEPMYAHFNSFDNEARDLFALGLGGEYHLSRRYALSFEYFPVLGDRIEGTKNAFAVAFNIETGGHVFQLFLASSDWTTEQYIIARNDVNFWAGDFRFGFNVNRVFMLGGH